MSPTFMAAASGCSPDCPGCTAKRARARRFRIAGFALIVLGLTAIFWSWPVDGLAGVGLSSGGIVPLWAGWYLLVRRAGRIDAEQRQSAATTRSIRGLNR